MKTLTLLLLTLVLAFVLPKVVLFILGAYFVWVFLRVTDESRAEKLNEPE